MDTYRGFIRIIAIRYRQRVTGQVFRILLPRYIGPTGEKSQRNVTGNQYTVVQNG